MTAIARHLWVSGSVQGVGFRYWTLAKAHQLGVRGWVRNLRDGRVEVWAEGEPPIVEEFVAWLAQGPPSARVTERRVVDVAPSGASIFEIRHD